MATKRIVPTAQNVPPKAIALVNDPPLLEIIAPPIGDPVNPANAEIVKTVPVRTPMSRMGESLAQRAGVRLMPAPEDTPKSAANTMMGALPDEGSQRPRIRIDVKAPMTIITLKCPTLSAMALGTVRPKRLEAYQLVTTIPGVEAGFLT